MSNILSIMLVYFVSVLQTLFDPYFISFYNVMYTSFPVLILGIFDQVFIRILCALY